MKNKILLSLLVIVMLFITTGCGNNTKEEINNKEEIIENTNTLSEEEIKLYSDDTKMVFELENVKHVFYYQGDIITAYHTYVDYNDLESAKYAYQYLKKEDLENVDKYYLKGRYIIFEMKDSEYEDILVSDLRNLYSYMKELKEE